MEEVITEGAESRRLAAFVHADMVGYSRLIGKDDAGTINRFSQLRRSLIQPALGRYGGKILNTAGDSLMMEFSSVLSAVRFAVEIQTRIPELDGDTPADLRIRFRMGVHIGDAIHDGESVHGDGVNIAARLQSISPPGCVCVSAIVRNHVKGLDLQFEPMGEVQLKNISQPIEAFTIRLDRPVRMRRGRRFLVVVAALLIVIGLGIVGWVIYPGAVRPPVEASNDGFSMAVLPFINLSNDRDEDYLADGISEDLTTDLSHLDGVVVVARESAFSYRGKQADVRDVGRQLGVRFALEGSVRKIGDAVRINAQLVDAHSGMHVWADRFDEPLRDLRDGQDGTVQRIGAALNLKFNETRRQPPMAEPDAYDLVLRAKAILQEPRSEDRNDIALGYFEQALRKDQTSVAAKTGVASMLLENSRPNMNRAANLVTQAEVVAPNSPDVLAAKFKLLMRQQRYEQAVVIYAKLLDIDSSSAGIVAEFARCISCWGDINKAVPLLERTALLNPLSPNRDIIYAALGCMLIKVGRNADAIDWLMKGLDVTSNILPSQLYNQSDFTFENIRLYLAAAYALSGHLDDAHAMLALAKTSPRMGDFTVSWFIANIPVYYNAEQRAQEMRLAEGFRLAGVPNHLDETADYNVTVGATLYDGINGTPTSVPGGNTIITDELVRLLEIKPLVLATTAQNPTVPGAILIGFPEVGSLTDEWQARLELLLAPVTHGDKAYPIVTFSWSNRRWQSRNLALRLIALGYTRVYWYRGGWEAWDAHNLPKAPLTSEFIAR